MNFRRKMSRGRHKDEVPRCCGRRMLYKGSMSNDRLRYYFCDRCGKEKWIEKRGTDERHN